MRGQEFRARGGLVGNPLDNQGEGRATEHHDGETGRTFMESVSLSVVIPLYNEEANVRPLLERLASTLANWPGGLEIVCVDDGSTDRTLAELHRAQKSDPRVRIAHFPRNYGQTAALAAGFRLARGRTVVTLDADLQNDPADIPGLVDRLNEFDVVCGIRVRRQDGWWKRFSSRIANGFRNWATGDDIADTGCTLKAYRKECLEGLELYHGLHRFLPTLLRTRGSRVAQVPVGHHPRLHGKTKYGTWGRLVKGLSDLWAVRWMQKNRLDFDRDMEIFEPQEKARADSTSGHAAERARVS